METFPEKFCYDYSNEHLSLYYNKKIKEQQNLKYKEVLSQCRQDIFSAYQKALDNNNTYIYINLQKYDNEVKKIVLSELLEKFSGIFYIRQHSDREILLRVTRSDIGNSVLQSDFIIVLTNFYYRENNYTHHHKDNI